MDEDEREKKNFAENGYYVPDEPISLTYHYNSIHTPKKKKNKFFFLNLIFN